MFKVFYVDRNFLLKIDVGGVNGSFHIRRIQRNLTNHATLLVVDFGVGNNSVNKKVT